MFSWPAFRFNRHAQQWQNGGLPAG